MDPALHIEPARLADARRIAEMSRDWIEGGLGWRWRPDSVRQLVRDPETAAVVARSGRTIHGFAIMGFHWERARAHLILLAVEPASRRQGLGAGLVRWLEEVARRGGIAHVGLEVRAGHEGARRFYRSLGYGETRRVAGYYQGREDAVEMVASLRRARSQPAR
ncbi:MAG: GNAT family N-acetyltransferase [Myxococcota bacterium]|nr:GNAT family N-acetyltransferase [Myxococcota bacterium]